MLTDHNIKTFKKAYKELYNFSMVRCDYSSACRRCRVACLNLPPYAECDHALIKEVREVESSHEWSPGACCQGKCISEEQMKNCYLQRVLDMLKQERTRETWLLKNDLQNLEKANFELQEQLEKQKKAH
jgi:hypothetical protein